MPDVELSTGDTGMNKPDASLGYLWYSLILSMVEKYLS